jgi:hypothetical protein
LYRSDGVTGCHDGGCGQLASSFLDDAGTYTVVYMLGTAAIVLAPAVIGLFWGAPLIAHEFETGTFRLAWTRTITRTRWLASKLALPGPAAMAVTAGLSLMFGWWTAPIGRAARLATGSSFPLGMGPFSLLAFDAHGITPSPWPSSPPSRSPCRWASARTCSRQPARAWILSTTAVNAAGQPVSAVPAACTHQGQSCPASHGIQVAVTYQPTSRYWAIQWTETGIYLALALAGYSFWRLNRRLS